MYTSTCSMRSLTFTISRTFCCSSFSIFNIEEMKSAIFPGWSMFTIFKRISSLNMGLFSLISFISLMSARVRAFTSKVSYSVSCRYSTAATRGSCLLKDFIILNLCMVETKTFTPPSGSFIFFMMCATVPTSYTSARVGFSISSFSITMPIKPSPSS